MPPTIASDDRHKKPSTNPEDQCPPWDYDPAVGFLAFARGGHNCFLTGMAGTGKSYTLRQFLDGIPEELRGTVSITAPTGIAALNVDGVTIHKWAGVGIGPRPGQSITDFIGELEMSRMPHIANAKRRIQQCRTLVIDEISMLPGIMMDVLDSWFRMVRCEMEKPFGGIQVIVTGDFLQLPPVNKKPGTPYDWAFTSQAWEQANFQMFYLEKVRRQDEPVFVNGLSAFRAGRFAHDQVVPLKRRVVAFPPSDLLRLFTHNVQVEKWNTSILEDLPGEATVYEAITSGNDEQIAKMFENMLTPRTLLVKPGCKVMFTRNDGEGRWVNGSMGKVVVCGEDSITVELIDAKQRLLIPAEVGRESWWFNSWNRDGAKVQQFPLRLAYAASIHKSQGLTLDGAYIDIRAAREPGQAYVALSRVRTLKGLHLKEWPKGVFVSEDAIAFYNKFAESAIQR